MLCATLVNSCMFSPTQPPSLPTGREVNSALHIVCWATMHCSSHP